MSPIWRHTPAPYGPLFVLLAGTVVGVTGSLVLSVVLFRLLALAGVALTAAYLPVLARRHGVPAGRALWLALASPLVVVHLASGGHNDALMIGLVVAGLAMAVAPPGGSGRRGRWVPLLLGGVLLGMAGAVKVTALVLVPFAALAALPGAWMLVKGRLAGRSRTGDAHPAGEAGPIARRGATDGWWVVDALRLPGAWRAGAWVAGGAAASMLALTALSRLGFGWVRGLSHSGDSMQWTSPATAVGMVIGRATRLMGGGRVNVVPVTRTVAMALLAVLLVWVFFRAARRGDPLHHGALAIVAVTAFSPVFHPWYAIAPLALLAVTARRPWWFVGFCGILSFLVLPNGASLAAYTKWPGAVAMTAAVVVAIAVALYRVIGTRDRLSAPATASTRAGDPGADLTPDPDVPLGSR